MVFVAVNKDGMEVVGDWLRRSSKGGIWLIMTLCSTGEESYEVAPSLPKGTIKQLIGRDLTWEDEPVKLYANHVKGTVENRRN